MIHLQTPQPADEFAQELATILMRLSPHDECRDVHGFGLIRLHRAAIARARAETWEEAAKVAEGYAKNYRAFLPHCTTTKTREDATRFAHASDTLANQLRYLGNCEVMGESDAS